MMQHLFGGFSGSLGIEWIEIQLPDSDESRLSRCGLPLHLGRLLGLGRNRQHPGGGEVLNGDLRPVEDRRQQFRLLALESDEHRESVQDVERLDFPPRLPAIGRD